MRHRLGGVHCQTYEELFDVTLPPKHRYSTQKHPRTASPSTSRPYSKNNNTHKTPISAHRPTSSTKNTRYKQMRKNLYDASMPIFQELLLEVVR